jgi:biotin carboxylase
MARVLLLLPSDTYRTADFMTAAASLGAEVVVASDHRLAIAPAMGQRPLTVSFDRPEEAADRIVAHARRMPLDAVIPVDDRGVEVAARAAARLGLAHNPIEAVVATRNKGALRAALTRAGVPQPAWRLVPYGRGVEEGARAVGLPCVLKPLSLSGSRGVIRADDLAGARRAAERVRAVIAEGCRNPQEDLLVESYVPGMEVALEGLLRDGKLEVLALFDKPDPLEGPFFEESIYVTPARIADRTADAIAARVGEACRALGLSDGPVHAEVRWYHEEVWVLEVAARSIGGLCARSLKFGLNTSLEELLLRHAVGASLDGLDRERAASGVMMIPISRDGELVGVRGVERAREVPGVAGVEITIPPGRRVRALPEGDRYLGFMFAREEDPDAVERALRSAHAKLSIEIRNSD